MPRLGSMLVLLVAGTTAVAADKGPSVSLVLSNRQATATPTRIGFCHTGGGNIDVAQPSPDTVVVTMTGVAVAGAHPSKASLAALAFELVQEFEIVLDKPEGKKAKLTLEASLIGLLRSHGHGGGSARIDCPAHAAITTGDTSLLDLALQGRAVAGGENLSINDQRGPVPIVLPAGKYTLIQRFGVQASHPRRLAPCKAASAEFAPDPALDPLWISAWEPFKGANKKSFGFRVTLKASVE